MNNEENNNSDFDEDEAADQLQQKRNKNKTAMKSALKKKAADVVTTPVRMGTNSLLRSAWLSMASVLGFIFIGLPYINLHAFGHFVMPSFFANLGEEWVPKGVKQFAGSFGKGTIWFTVIEWIALIILDIGVLFIVLMSLVIFFIIIDTASGIFGFFIRLVT